MYETAHAQHCRHGGGGRQRRGQSKASTARRPAEALPKRVFAAARPDRQYSFRSSASFSEYLPSSVELVLKFMRNEIRRSPTLDALTTLQGERKNNGKRLGIATTILQRFKLDLEIWPQLFSGLRRAIINRKMEPS